MIDIYNIRQLLIDNGDTHLQVTDTSKNKLYNVSGDSAEDAFAKLEKHFELLKGYKRLIIKAGDQKSANSSFTNARSYTVYFPEGETPSQGQVVSGPNMLSPELFNTRLELEKLKQENAFNERIRKIEEKLEGKNEGLDKYIGYIPFAAKLMGWTKDEVKEIMGLHFMSKNMQLSGASTEVLPKKNTLSVEGTHTEKVERLEKLIVSACNENTIGIDKIIFLLDHLVKNPAMVDQAIAFINMSQKS